MPKDSDIIYYEQKRQEAGTWIRKLSDEQYVALDVSLSIESYEQQIKHATETLKRLKEAAKNLPNPPKVPEGMHVDSSLLAENLYRFRGNRELQLKLYGF